jgi:hypothetical protein
MRALLATQAAHPDVHLPSFADDTHIIGRSDAALAAFHHLAAQVGQLNLRVKLTKCVAYSPSPVPAIVAIPADFIRPADGIRVWELPSDQWPLRSSLSRSGLTTMPDHWIDSLNCTTLSVLCCC